jgi:hypothetical protein
VREPLEVDVCHEQQLSELGSRGWQRVSWARVVWLDPSSDPSTRTLLDRWVCRECDDSPVMWNHNQPYLIQTPGVSGRSCVKVADIRKGTPWDQPPPFMRSENTNP